MDIKNVLFLILILCVSGTPATCKANWKEKVKSQCSITSGVLLLTSIIVGVFGNEKRISANKKHKEMDVLHSNFEQCVVKVNKRDIEYETLKHKKDDYKFKYQDVAKKYNALQKGLQDIATNSFLKVTDKTVTYTWTDESGKTHDEVVSLKNTINPKVHQRI